ncbi:hypothetical protein CH249_01445 [Rhodococcus sp. 05-2255-3B1]|uniref:trypsin-like serine peptidase n=1 Tax=unclassified Rhodococcus (in: high G+C Gram-positive bacteria) TaxID=192944 RepID=UPI000B9A5C1A|nr:MULTISPECIES: hypothetical protein [unclassified Rhodococcus (in: high G+C Gram-positive bacteria)]OZE13437.1 hypothetical protein CH250_05920 [Rhodococcus sp. 05-2255-3C]OZE15948.1 hypothetical protein CH249_01445 [Rhodococcus sp. 05-2255-3B1]OZE18987.1 hypothetical protein CH255_13470 [Rhodococcus sp. 05-2255-2A2]
MDHESNQTDDPQAISDYWTPERMANAQPKGRTVSPAALGRAAVDDDRGISQPPTPQATTSTSRSGFNPDEHQVSEATLAARRVPDPTAYPYRTIGKLFFVSDGKDYVGSASAIAKDGLITAAHNLYDGASRSWSSKIHFVPAYADSVAPFGVWNWNKAWVYDEWVVHDTDAYDVGLIRLDPSSTGKNIGDLLGYLGMKVERPAEGEWIDIGYPSAIDGGKYMIESDGRYTRSLDGGKVVGKKGKLGKGASGGPWLLRDDPRYVNGIHAFSQAATPDESFSPYFRQSILDFVSRHFPVADK